MRIGFIGTGVMGKSIVKHFLSAGHEVSVYNRTKSKTDDLVEHGAMWQPTPAEVTATSDIIFLWLGIQVMLKKFILGKTVYIRQR